MEYICLFAPAFISLFLKYKAEENLKAKILNIICYYFIIVNIINLSVMIVAKLFFNNYSFEFTTSISIKYLMLANVFAIFLADYTWYDGNIYSGNYIEEATDEYIANNEYMMDRLNFNKMIISNNYYSYEE